MNLSDLIQEILEKYPEPDEFNNNVINLLNDVPYEERAYTTYEIGKYLYNNQYFKHAIKIFDMYLSFGNSDDRQTVANCLISLGNAYKAFSNPQKAIEQYEKALPIVREIGDTRGESGCYINLGLAYKLLSNPKKTIEQYEKALPIVKDRGDRRGESGCYIGLGNAYRALLSNPQKAREQYEKALPIVKDLGDRGGEAACYIGLGNAYYDLSNPQKAIEYYEKALPIVGEINERGGEADCYINLGNAYSALSNPQRAIEYYEKALPIVREIIDSKRESKCYIGLGNAYSALSNPQKAIEYYEKALPIVREIGDREGESNCYINLGSIYGALLSNPQKAIEYYEKALPIKTEIGDKEHESITHENLGAALIELNKFDEAYANLKSSIYISESIGASLIEEEHKIGYYGSKSDSYSLIVPLCLDLKIKEEAYNYVQRGKSKAFIDLLSTSNAEPTVTDNKEMLRLVARERELIVEKKRMQLKSIIIVEKGGREETDIETTITTKEKRKYELQYIIDELNKIYDMMEHIDPEYVSLRRPKPISSRRLQELI
jgi:tetratricopeptide (TPR) repeat protein